MESLIICTIKNWNIKNARKFANKVADKYRVYVIDKKENLTEEFVKKINPRFIFFPHWSFKIEEEIYKNFECVVFHMTDLPYGRGGSPLQNLIAKGIYETKISAIRVTEALDAGPIYCKSRLALLGKAQDIYEKCSRIIFEEMIPEILEKRMIPIEQVGEAVCFRRRKPEQSRIPIEVDNVKLYDHIRMLDAEGYPSAFIEFGDYRLEFSDAEMIDDKVTAKVVFFKK